MPSFGHVSTVMYMHLFLDLFSSFLDQTIDIDCSDLKPIIFMKLNSHNGSSFNGLERKIKNSKSSIWIQYTSTYIDNSDNICRDFNKYCKKIIMATDGNIFDVEVTNTCRSQPLMLKRDPNVSIRGILDIKPKNKHFMLVKNYKLLHNYKKKLKPQCILYDDLFVSALQHKHKRR